MRHGEDIHGLTLASTVSLSILLFFSATSISCSFHIKQRPASPPDGIANLSPNTVLRLGGYKWTSPPWVTTWAVTRSGDSERVFLSTPDEEVFACGSVLHPSIYLHPVANKRSLMPSVPKDAEFYLHGVRIIIPSGAPARVSTGALGGCLPVDPISLAVFGRRFSIDDGCSATIEGASRRELRVRDSRQYFQKLNSRSAQRLIDVGVPPSIVSQVRLSSLYDPSHRPAARGSCIILDANREVLEAADEGFDARADPHWATWQPISGDHHIGTSNDVLIEKGTPLFWLDGTPAGLATSRVRATTGIGALKSSNGLCFAISYMWLNSRPVQIPAIPFCTSPCGFSASDVKRELAESEPTLQEMIYSINRAWQTAR